MATNDIMKLTGSAQGEPVLIESTGPAGSAGTLIMQVPAGKKGRLELWAWSNSAQAVALTLQLGALSAARELTVNIPPRGSDPKPVVFFWPFEADAEVRAYASVANMACVAGHFNERDPAS
jgi:hypothetical protein